MKKTEQDIWDRFCRQVFDKDINIDLNKNNESKIIYKFKIPLNFYKIKIKSKLVKIIDDIDIRTDFEIDDRFSFETFLYKGKLRIVKYPESSTIKYDSNNEATVFITKINKIYLFLLRKINMNKHMKLFSFLDKLLNPKHIGENFHFNIINYLYKTNYK